MKGLIRVSQPYVLSKYLGAVLGSPIAAGTAPCQIAVSPNGMVAAAYNESNALQLFNTATNAVYQVVTGTGSAPTIPDPVMVFTPDSSLLYTIDPASNSVKRIVVATGAITSISVGTSPQGLAISPDGSIIYVVNKTSNDITKIIVATGVTSTISTGVSMGGDIAFTPDGTLAFAGGFSSNMIVRIVVATGATSTIDFGNHQSGLAITSDGRTLWVVTSQGFRSYTIGTSTINAGIAHGVGSPGGCYIDPTNSYVFTYGFTLNVVKKLTIGTGVVSTINTGQGPNQIAISPDGTVAYVACGNNNTISRIDVRTDAVATISAGNAGYYLAYGRDGRRVYLSNYSGNSLSVIDTLAAAA